MTSFYQITENEVISGVCKAISSVYGMDLSIYKEKTGSLTLPAVTVYCINHTNRMERFDRFVNTFNIIINYHPQDSVKIKNKRMDMGTQTQRIMQCIRYIPLPAYNKTSDGQYQDITLPCRASDIQSQENEQGFMQISATYTVNTKYVPDEGTVAKFNKIECSLKLK
jgi:hypothetical protein